MLLLFAGVLVIAVALLIVGGVVEAPAWLGGRQRWPHASPSEVGMDEATLRALERDLGRRGMDAFLVLRRGVLVRE